MEFKEIEELLKNYNFKVLNYKLISDGATYYHFFEYEFDLIDTVGDWGDLDFGEQSVTFIDNIKIKYGENIKLKLLNKFRGY